MKFLINNEDIAFASNTGFLLIAFFLISSLIWLFSSFSGATWSCLIISDLSIPLKIFILLRKITPILFYFKICLKLGFSFLGTAMFWDLEAEDLLRFLNCSSCSFSLASCSFCLRNKTDSICLRLRNFSL